MCRFGALAAAATIDKTQKPSILVIPELDVFSSHQEGHGEHTFTVAGMASRLSHHSVHPT